MADITAHPAKLRSQWQIALGKANRTNNDLAQHRYRLEAKLYQIGVKYNERRLAMLDSPEKLRQLDGQLLVRIRMLADDFENLHIENKLSGKTKPSELNTPDNIALALTYSLPKDKFIARMLGLINYPPHPTS